ncbi:MAG: GTPase [Planctomycetota bacterium]
MCLQDTIAALSSAPGPGARAIVRVSGPSAFAVVLRVLAEGGDRVERAQGFSWLEARVRLRGGKLLLPVELFVMRSPRSYTREDLLEFHMLGSMPLSAMLLEALYEAGARPAEPGEFTRRAYLAGRIGLEQAEAVARLVAARSEAARRVALRRLEGRLDLELARLREAFVRILAVAEATVDFTEADTEALDRGALVAELREIERSLERIEGVLHSRPADETALQIVLYGARNAGKSTLFSRLVPERETLVSPVPGTTRDLVEGVLHLEGLAVALWDAPGVGEAADPLEAEAIEHLHTFLARCDLLLVVLDAAGETDPADTLMAVERAIDRPRLVVLSRSDRGVREEARNMALEVAEEGWPPVEISAVSGSGIAALLDQVTRRGTALSADQETGTWSIDAGLRVALDRARRAVRAAIETDLEIEIEMAIFELREALLGLTPWVEAVSEEEILDRVFSQFCIGK